MTGLEPFIFAALVATIAAGKGWSDIPFMLRGKTPPSHEYRMQALRQKEQAAGRREAARQARRDKPRPVRDYFRALVDHSVTTAHQRRLTKWDAIDPVKADRYRKKMADRAEKLRAQHAAKEAGEKVGLGKRLTDNKAKAKDWLERNKFIAERVPAAAGTAVVTTDDDDKDRAKTTPPESAPEQPTDETPEGSNDTPSDKAGESEPAPEKETGDKPAASEGDADQMATVHPIRNEQKESAKVAVSEVVTLDDAIQLVEEWKEACATGTTNLESAVASLQQAKVGPGCIQAFAEAAEGLENLVATFENAREKLQDSVQVADQYDASPDAGEGDFVRNRG
ncbi:hypothetical protein ABN028_19900 [Actinopolymorpha sp. B17G11]|uniref:hypothetical protein n=1 Tax=Actinopolymorpha sp. B17G11 TaxID=3160861 RepID=UPI0032E3B16C